MTTRLLIDRELLERVWRALANSTTRREIGAYLDADPCAPECAETCARASMCATCSADLSAPRQPEGGGLEVVAWQDAENPLYTTGERRQMHAWATDGYPIVALCRLSDAERAIAELREKNKCKS